MNRWIKMGLGGLRGRWKQAKRTGVLITEAVRELCSGWDLGVVSVFQLGSRRREIASGQWSPKGNSQSEADSLDIDTSVSLLQ